jgi:peptidoglycan lytic transglycosylase
LAGRHAAPRTPKKVRYLVPLAAAALVAAVLVGVSVTTGGLGGVFASNDATLADPPATSHASEATASLSPSGQPSLTPTRSTQRASRDLARTPKPSVSPSRSPSRSPSKSPTKASTVVDTGTCGVSYYSTGSVTANGESFDPDGLTAAHKTLAFNTRVRVTNTANGKSVVVRINDRGPFVSGRCLDLARGAFATIASLSSGVITAKYEVLD